jgi:hypothetical protein
MRLKAGDRFKVRLAQDPTRWYRGVVVDFILPTGKRLSELNWDTARRNTVLNGQVEFHVGPRHCVKGRDEVVVDV